MSTCGVPDRHDSRDVQGIIVVGGVGEQIQGPGDIVDGLGPTTAISTGAAVLDVPYRPPGIAQVIGQRSHETGVVAVTPPPTVQQDRHGGGACCRAGCVTVDDLTGVVTVGGGHRALPQMVSIRSQRKRPGLGPATWSP